MSTDGSNSGQRDQTPPGIVRLLFVCGAAIICAGVAVIATNTDLVPRILGAIALISGCGTLVVATLARSKSPTR